MTLENTLIKNLSEWRPASRDPLLVSEAGSPWTIQVTADHCELLGARLWELSASRKEPPADVTIADWANRIAAQSASLQEPLKVLEVDDKAQQALLRSQNPVQRDGKVSYYEVQLKGTTSATLRRYQAAQEGNARREQVGFVLTHENSAAVVAALIA